MRFMESILGIHEIGEDSCLALGNFDGVHKGHQALIERAVNKAKASLVQSVVLTFEPHPKMVLNKEKAPKNLLTQRQKMRLIEQIGVDMLVFLPFTISLARLDPREFVEKVLVQYFHPQTIVVGYNYTFGKGGTGTAETLKALGYDYGFQVEIVAPVMLGQVPISSTLVRQALSKGQIGRAKDLLGYWPLLEGVVVEGDQRGRKLGFPTANLEVDDNLLLPANGVYAVRANCGNGWLPGVLNIGRKPTFGDELPVSIEVHILDFSGWIYGSLVEVQFLKQLRGEKRFNSISCLVEQIKKDIAMAQKVFQCTE